MVDQRVLEYEVKRSCGSVTPDSIDYYFREYCSIMNQIYIEEARVDRDEEYIRMLYDDASRVINDVIDKFNKLISCYMSYIVENYELKRVGVIE